jgi:hypothetical protein
MHRRNPCQLGFQTRDAFPPAADFPVQKPRFFVFAQDDDGKILMSRFAHYGQVS